MTRFDHVSETLKDLPFMNRVQAEIMRDFIRDNDVSDILEVGFYKGKSSAYFAAILDDIGRGHLTTIDKRSARTYSPNILETVGSVGLTHRVTPVFSHRSHTWELGKMARTIPRPQFDMCYFDGGHTWDVTGLGFVLVDILLKPGGWIVFDDMNWTINKSVERNPERSGSYKNYSDDEKDMPAVRLVFETLLPHFRYRNMGENKTVGWGFAQKP